MIPYMKGGGEDRKLRFCVGAKLCSGKAASEEEARQICISAPPKEPKTRKSKKAAKSGDCAAEMNAIAVCLIPYLDEPDFKSRLGGLLQQCACGGTTKPDTKEKFIKKCFKENSSTGTLQIPLQEAAKLRSFCTNKWKEEQAGPAGSEQILREIKGESHHGSAVLSSSEGWV
jgi:hypothetical protein